MAVTMRADDHGFLLESADRAMTALVDASVRLGLMTSDKANIPAELSEAMRHVEAARRVLRHQTEVVS